MSGSEQNKCVVLRSVSQSVCCLSQLWHASSLFPVSDSLTQPVTVSRGTRALNLNIKATEMPKHFLYTSHHTRAHTCTHSHTISSCQRLTVRKLGRGRSETINAPGDVDLRKKRVLSWCWSSFMKASAWAQYELRRWSPWEAVVFNMICHVFFFATRLHHCYFCNMSKEIHALVPKPCFELLFPPWEWHPS